MLCRVGFALVGQAGLAFFQVFHAVGGVDQALGPDADPMAVVDQFGKVRGLEVD